MAFAIQAIHNKLVLHRDIKPQNVFLTADKSVKIGDLGIARELNRASEMAKTMTGTISYMSPEVLDAKPYSYPSDIWALGCVLYEMCTFQLPFEGEGLGGICDAVLNHPHVPIPAAHYSANLRELIDRMLIKD